MTDAEHIKKLEARVAELERRLIGATGGYGPPIGSQTVYSIPDSCYIGATGGYGPPIGSQTVYSIPDSCYFDNGKAMFGGRGGGGQG